MSDTQPRGYWRRLSPARKFVSDVLHFARQVPSVPVARRMQLASVAEARKALSSRPGWTAIFMRAYSLVCRRHPQLRQLFVPYPWEHLYEHPHSVCGVIIEREYRGERVVLPVQLRGPENQSLAEIDHYIDRCQQMPIEEIGYFRQALQVGSLPKPVRRLLWWITIRLSGFLVAKRLGTFALTSYGRLGAEQIHPLGLLTTTLTFGPISSAGDVVVKLIYDHRVLDGPNVARILDELEQTLNGEIVAELRAMAGATWLLPTSGNLIRSMPDSLAA